MTSSDNARMITPSSYMLLIAETVLGQFDLFIDPQILLEELKNPLSTYSLIIQTPTFNILNQLILAQVISYQHFVQKKLIDYYARSASQNELVEDECGDSFYPETIQLMKQSCLEKIKSSAGIEQNLLDILAKTNQITFEFLKKQTIGVVALQALDNESFNQKMKPCLESAKLLREQLLQLREEWRAYAIDFNQKFSSVMPFGVDELTDLELRSELDFFQNLGLGKN